MLARLFWRVGVSSFCLSPPSTVPLIPKPTRTGTVARSTIQMQTSHDVSPSVKAQEIGQAFVNALMAENAVQDIEGTKGTLRIIQNLPILEAQQYGQAEMAVQDVILRSRVEEYWLECIRQGDSEKRVAAVGTCGIGKTKSIPHLIYLLLLQRRRVLFIIRSRAENSWYYDFIPQNNSDGGSGMDVKTSYLCKVYPETTIEGDWDGFKDRNSYYIVDPGTSDNDCMPGDYYGDARIVLVTDPDNRHYGKALRKGLVEVVIYPLWSLEELLMASPYFNQRRVGQGLAPLTSEQIVQRFYHFGGVPRYVFATPAECKTQLRFQEHAIHGLDSHKTSNMLKAETFGTDYIDRWNRIVIGVRPARGTYSNIYSAGPISWGVGARMIDRFRDSLWAEAARDPSMLTCMAINMLATTPKELCAVPYGSSGADCCTTISVGGFQEVAHSYNYDLIDQAFQQPNVVLIYRKFPDSSSPLSLLNFVYSEKAAGDGERRDQEKLHLHAFIARPSGNSLEPAVEPRLAEYTQQLSSYNGAIESFNIYVLSRAEEFTRWLDPNQTLPAFDIMKNTSSADGAVPQIVLYQVEIPAPNCSAETGLSW